MQIKKQALFRKAFPFTIFTPTVPDTWEETDQNKINKKYHPDYFYQQTKNNYV